MIGQESDEQSVAFSWVHPAFVASPQRPRCGLSQCRHSRDVISLSCHSNNSLCFRVHNSVLPGNSTAILLSI